MVHLTELITAAEGGDAVADHLLREFMSDCFGSGRELPKEILGYYRKAMLSDPLDGIDRTKAPRLNAPTILQ